MTNIKIVRRFARGQYEEGTEPEIHFLHRERSAAAKEKRPGSPHLYAGLGCGNGAQRSVHL